MKLNSKIISSYDMLRARTFCVCRKSLCARYVHAYEFARDFLRSVTPFFNASKNEVKFFTIFCYIRGIVN